MDAARLRWHCTKTSQYRGFKGFKGMCSGGDIAQITRVRQLNEVVMTKANTNNPL